MKYCIIIAYSREKRQELFAKNTALIKAYQINLSVQKTVQR